MFVDDNEDASLDDILEHFGVRGMKWGVRRGKGVTGVSRSRGALLDKNAHTLKRFEDAKSALNNGGGSTSSRVANRINRMTMGKNRTERYYNANISHLKAQNDRVKAGKLKLRDRLATLNTTPISRLITVTPA